MYVLIKWYTYVYNFTLVTIFLPYDDNVGFIVFNSWYSFDVYVPPKISRSPLPHIGGGIMFWCVEILCFIISL